jgi:RNA polymerase sigma-70 factor (ECF subfamily)
MDTISLAQQSKSIQREQEQALVQCRKGDREAFARLMRLYQRQIFNYTYRMLGNAEEAEDLTQDIFVAAFRGIRGFRGEAKFSTWLFRIALNQTRNRIKPQSYQIPISQELFCQTGKKSRAREQLHG